MSVMVIRPERGCDDIHALIDHVLSDGAGCTEADFPDSCRGRFVILTPASLRAYVKSKYCSRWSDRNSENVWNRG